MSKLNRTLLSIVFLFSSLTLCCQSISENIERMGHIIVDDNYISCLSESSTYEDARRQAQQQLAEQIYSIVKSKSTTSIYSKEVNGDIEEQTSVSNETEIISELEIHDFHYLLVGKPDNKKNKSYKVFAYIERKKAEEIRSEKKEAETAAEQKRWEEHRKEKEELKRNIDFYYEKGIERREKLDIGNALKNFFSGYVLSSGTNEIIEEQPAQLVFSDLISNTLANIYVIVDEIDEETINKTQKNYIKKLKFYYQCNDDSLRKLDNLDFNYFNGKGIVQGSRVRNGLSQVKLVKDLPSFNLTCYFDNPNEFDPHIKKVMESKELKDFTEKEKTVDCEHYYERSSQHDLVVDALDEHQPINSVISTYDATRYDTLTDIMYDIEKAIREKTYNPIKDYFTENGWDCFDRLINYGNANLITAPAVYDFIEYDGLIICRSMTMEFNFKNNKRFTENVVYRFNKDNQIESLAFALTDIAQKDIFDNDDWNRDAKLALLSFMEDYQTAYALKRIDYLKQIFSDDALIITGYKVMRKEKGDGIKLRSSVQYDTLSKSEYMSRLQRHFKEKEFINLNFLETEFEQAQNHKGLFSVRLRQEYYSNTYGDVGYLFLAVDLRKKEEPTILVRAWQEDKLPLDKLISLRNFRR